MPPMKALPPKDRIPALTKEASSETPTPVIAPEQSGMDASDAKLKIYFLPNLMTAGNLFCGFVALTKIVEADVDNPVALTKSINEALFFILLACVFDLLDGRLARMGGQESPFGQEFDSLADLISFGAAPAFLVHRYVLKDVTFPTPAIGWFIALVYIVCGAFRLARFNALAIVGDEKSTSKDFIGFPIPAAAGLIASITMFLLLCAQTSRDSGLNFDVNKLRFVLPIILIFLSIMMVSNVRYPSFKTLNLKSKSPFLKLVGAVLYLGLIFIMGKNALATILPLLFTAYLVYGFIRPHISRKRRHEIEDQFENEGPMDN